MQADDIDAAEIVIDVADSVVAPEYEHAIQSFPDKDKYIFKISARANKSQVKAAIEKLYKVKVEKVNTVTIPKKARVRGRVLGWKSSYRKAVVTLKKGDKIDVFEGK